MANRINTVCYVNLGLITVIDDSVSHDEQGRDWSWHKQTHIRTHMHIHIEIDPMYVFKSPGTKK